MALLLGFSSVSARKLFGVLVCWEGFRLTSIA
jgi:hypothetical protein